MKLSFLALLPIVCAAALHAEDLSIKTSREHSHISKRVWIRRATLAASCAASLVLDTWSTHRALSTGAIESNPVLANSRGGTNWGRTIAIKAGVCAVSGVLEETGTFHSWQTPNADWTWTGINAATTATYTWVTLHNLGIAAQISK